MKKHNSKTKKELQKEVAELSSQFKEGLEQLFQSNEYLQFLDTMAHRPKYSFMNNLLIFLQYPYATYIAGYRKFLKDHDLQVQKDEKGIRIFAPVLKKYKTTQKRPVEDTDDLIEQEEIEREYLSFRIVHVFDVSQTKPITIKNEKGEDIISPKAQEFLDSLSFMTNSKVFVSDEINIQRLITAVTAAIPIPIRYRPLQKDLCGYFSFQDKNDLHIVLNSIYDEGNIFDTLIHEWVHYELHNPYSENKETSEPVGEHDMEIQAESSAYIVLKHFGIDVEQNALKYVLSWSKKKTSDELIESMETIQKISQRLISAIEENLSDDFLDSSMKKNERRSA